MEHLEQATQIIDLGKLIVKQLDLDRSVDTLSRWMSHYLAGKLTELDTLEGESKEAAEKECFELILKLWEHRHAYNNNVKPLKEFDTIIEFLDKLSIKKESPLFFNYLDKEKLPKLEEDNPKIETIEEWISLTKGIDKIARAQIEFALNQAAKLAKNDETLKWIEKSKGLSQNADIFISEKLLLTFSKEDDLLVSDKDDAVEEYKHRINQLEQFSRINEYMLGQLKEEVDKLQD